MSREHNGLALLRGDAVVLAVTLFTLLFGLLTALVLRTDLQPTAWDRQITHEVQEFPAPVGAVLVAVSQPGFPPWSILMLVGIMLVLLLFRWYADAVFTALAFGGAVLADIIKNLIDRPRPNPDLAHVTKVLNSYSFPSGHATAYVTIFGFILYLAYTLLPRKQPLRLPIMLLCGLLIVLVGPSRIYMGQHWASDVLAGYLLGFAYLLPLIQLHRAWLRRTSKPNSGSNTATSSAAPTVGKQP